MQQPTASASCQQQRGRNIALMVPLAPQRTEGVEQLRKHSQYLKEEMEWETEQEGGFRFSSFWFSTFVLRVASSLQQYLLLLLSRQTMWHQPAARYCLHRSHGPYTPKALKTNKNLSGIYFLSSLVFSSVRGYFYSFQQKHAERQQILFFSFLFLPISSCMAASLSLQVASVCVSFSWIFFFNLMISTFCEITCQHSSNL